MSEESEEQFYTVSQVARMIQVSPSTIWRWIKEGRLSSVKIGDARRIRSRDLQNLLREEPAPYLVAEEPSPTDAGTLIEEIAADLERTRRRLGGNLPDSADLLAELREERSR